MHISVSKGREASSTGRPLAAMVSMERRRSLHRGRRTHNQLHLIRVLEQVLREQHLTRWYWIILQSHEQHLQRFLEQKQHELSNLIAAVLRAACIHEYSQEHRMNVMYGLFFRSNHLLNMIQSSRLRVIYQRMQALWQGPDPRHAEDRWQARSSAQALREAWLELRDFRHALSRHRHIVEL